MILIKANFKQTFVHSSNIFWQLTFSEYSNIPRNVYIEDTSSVNQVYRRKCSNTGTHSSCSNQCNYWHYANFHSRYHTVFLKDFTNKWRGGVLGPYILGTKCKSVEISSSKLMQSYFPISFCWFAKLKVTWLIDQVLYSSPKNEQDVSTEKSIKWNKHVTKGSQEL